MTAESAIPPRGSVVTSYDGQGWCNWVVGSYVVANHRDTAEEATLKGRAMAEMRRADHLVTNREGALISHVRYD